MWGVAPYSDILSGWIKCGVPHSIVVYCQGGLMWGVAPYSGILSGWIKCGVPHSIVVYCQDGLDVGCRSL